MAFYPAARAKFLGLGGQEARIGAMASRKPEVNRAITEAINTKPPRDDKLTDEQKAERERATAEYLTRVAEGQTRTQLRYRSERYKG